jgi:hypothetical protein
MAMYVYSTQGEPVGFLFETFIFDLGGTPLGRIIGARVHRLDGSYAGEWFKEMVVERRAAPARTLPAVPPPPSRASPGRGTRRRVVVDYGYPDRFHRLYQSAADDPGPVLGRAAE